MKKTILLSLVAATVLFTACDEKTKSEITDATSAVTSSVKETASKAVDATKEAASNVADKAVEKAGDVVDTAKETASNVVDVKDAAVEKATEATEVVADAADNAAGKAAYAKCAGCHGKDGKTQALGKSAVIAGQDAETLVTSMHEYKAGTRNVAGMGTLMKGQVASMSDEDIKAVSEYISGM